MATQTNNELIKKLFDAGAHFGFSKSRRHPTTTPYLYGTKNGNDILDIEQSARAIEEAKALLRQAGESGKVVLFVGTKDEASATVKAVADGAQAPAVYNRWIGGMLTNFPEIKKRIKRLVSLLEDKETGELEKKYTKKERLMIDREVEKLNHNFGSIKTLEKKPDIMVVVDPRHDSIAVHEANDTNIPVIAIMSSDCDASTVTHPILVNDSLTASISTVLGMLTDAYSSGKQDFTSKSTQSQSKQ